MENNINRAFNDIAVRSAGGAPFLFAYGATFTFTAVLSFFLPKSMAALIAMFQGCAALPLAFWLEGSISRHIRRGRCSSGVGLPTLLSNNPLQHLSAQLAISQVLALPALIVAYRLHPGAIPILLASLGGVHLFPYAWLHQARIYLFLSSAMSIGGFVIQLCLGTSAFSYILLYIGTLYLLSAPFLYKRAAQLVDISQK